MHGETQEGSSRKCANDNCMCIQYLQGNAANRVGTQVLLRARAAEHNPHATAQNARRLAFAHGACTPWLRCGRTLCIAAGTCIITAKRACLKSHLHISMENQWIACTRGCHARIQWCPNDPQRDSALTRQSTKAIYCACPHPLFPYAMQLILSPRGAMAQRSAPFSTLLLR